MTREEIEARFAMPESMNDETDPVKIAHTAALHEIFKGTALAVFDISVSGFEYMRALSHLERGLERAKECEPR